MIVKNFFSHFEVGGDGIKLRLVRARLPRLEIITLEEELLVGLVPTRYSMLIDCIDNGWRYYGNILKIEGSKYDPKIFVSIKGEK